MSRTVAANSALGEPGGQGSSAEPLDHSGVSMTVVDESVSPRPDATNQTPSGWECPQAIMTWSIRA